METQEVSTAQIAKMPLHAITEMLGKEGLVRRFDYEVGRLAVADRQEVNDAFLVSNELHANDPRQREPYINHPLRVASRMMVHYAVKDPDVIAAGLMHDCAEDHYRELTPFGLTPNKDAAIDTIEVWFNDRVARLVASVTNPNFDPDRDKNEQYIEHLKHVVDLPDPWPSVIKLSDFTDNATGLIYTDNAFMVKKLSRKYLPVVPVLRAALNRNDFPLDHSVVSHIDGQLDLTTERLSLMAA